MQKSLVHLCFECEHRDSSGESSWEIGCLAGICPATFRAKYTSSKQHRIEVRF